MAQVRQAMLEMRPHLTVSESTVWRAMRDADLRFVRAQYYDPRASGTAAKRAEMDAFVAEQARGAAGAFAVDDLFFMDETVVYLNEVTSRAWGTRKAPPVLPKSKGKTMAIALYAGIGLTSSSARLETVRDSCAVSADAPRSNLMRLDDTGCWRVVEEAPSVCFVWWMRPPERAEPGFRASSAPTTCSTPPMCCASAGRVRRGILPAGRGAGQCSPPPSVPAMLPVEPKRSCSPWPTTAPSCVCPCCRRWTRSLPAPLLVSAWSGRATTPTLQTVPSWPCASSEESTFSKTATMTPQQ